MHRIDTSTALPGGHFTDGNPSLGQPATRLNASWFESVQEELAAVIEGGGEALDVSENNQLLLAIQNLIASALLSVGGRKSPVGTIRFSACSVAEEGEFHCLHQEVSRTTFATLFAKIGTTFGAGDGVSTFNLPDGRGRAFIGSGFGPGLTVRSAGQLLGEETHTLTEPEMPEHVHDYGVEDFTTYPISLNDIPLATRTGGHVEQSTSAGGGQAHNNMQPSAVCYVFITYE